MGRIKVLQILTRLEAGGSAANTLACARRLGDGFESFLACGIVEKGLEEPAGDLKLIRLPHLKRSISLWEDVRAFFEILDLLRREKPDIVHTHTSKAGFLGRWAAFLYKRSCRKSCVVIHTPHGHVFYGYFGPLKSWLFTLLERCTSRFTDKLVALSQGERTESLARAIGTPSQWTIIASGVRIPMDEEMAQLRAQGRALREKLGLPEDSLVIGTVARLEPVKGVETLVRAAPLILQQSPTVRFLLVGDGSQRARLQGLSVSLGLHEQIIFLGHQDNALAAMAAMDIYVQPSLNEGLGRTLIEAALLDLASAASDVCGIRDIVLDGQTGILVKPADAADLAQAVGRLAADATLRRLFGRAARAHVMAPDENGLARFSERAMLEKLSRLYLSSRKRS